MLELKDEVDLNTTLWHIMDDGSDSVRLLGNLLETHGDGPTYFVARNLGRGADFSLFDASDEKKQAEQLGATNINIPNLHSGTMRKIDRTGASLWAAANNRDAAVGPTLNLLERQRAKIWLNKAYSELRWAMRPPRKQRDNA